MVANRIKKNFTEMNISKILQGQSRQYEETQEFDTIVKFYTKDNQQVSKIYLRQYKCSGLKPSMIGFRFRKLVKLSLHFYAAIDNVISKLNLQL